MNCRKAQRLVDPYVDGELDVVATLDLEEHLEACPECAWLHESRLAVRTAMREERIGFRAPDGLGPRVRTAVRRVAEGEIRPVAGPSDEAPAGAAPAGAAPAGGRPLSARPLGWMAIAASLLVAVISVGVVWRTAGPSGGRDTVARDAVASHVRSLMADHLTDVPSSDQHTVKPWFDGKIDFAPPVVDLADRDFALVGGRMDYVADEPVAALVYQRRKHVINLFVSPSGGAGAPERVETYKGYNVVRWTDVGMDFCAVSDLNAGELGELAGELRTRIDAPKGP